MMRCHSDNVEETIRTVQLVYGFFWYQYLYCWLEAISLSFYYFIIASRWRLVRGNESRRVSRFKRIDWLDYSYCQSTQAGEAETSPLRSKSLSWKALCATPMIKLYGTYGYPSFPAMILSASASLNQFSAPLALCLYIFVRVYLWAVWYSTWLCGSSVVQIYPGC
jgi:hypothetical protein